MRRPPGGIIRRLRRRFRIRCLSYYPGKKGQAYGKGLPPSQSSGLRFPFEWKPLSRGRADRPGQLRLSGPLNPTRNGLSLLHLCTGRRPICTFAPRTARGAVPTLCCSFSCLVVGLTDPGQPRLSGPLNPTQDISCHPPPETCLSLLHLCTGRRPICTFAPRAARSADPTNPSFPRNVSSLTPVLSLPLPPPLPPPLIQ